METFPKNEAVPRLAPVEDRLRRLIDTIPALVLSARPDGSVEFVNQGWREYTGSSLEELTGWGWTAAVHPEDLARFVEKWRASLATGATFEAEGRLRRADGRFRWFLSRGVALRDELGNILKWYGATIDIEDRKRAEDALQHNEELLRFVVDTTPALVHTGHPDGDLDFFNQRWLKYVGLSLEDMCGWRWTAVVHPEDVAAMVERWRAAVATGEPFEHEARVRRADGEYRWMFHRKVALRDERGKIVKWYGSSIDIEDRKQAEDALRRSEFYLAEGQRLAHMGSWAISPSGSYDHWSRELFRIYGLDPAKGVPTLEEYLGSVHPQDREFMARSVREMLAEGLGCDVKKRILRPDGELRYIRCVGVPDLDNGILKSIVGTAIDVTEQEQLTQELQRRGMYLAEAQRLSHTGSFGWRPSAGEILWSEETSRIFQYDPATKPTVELVLQRVHPEDAALVQQTIERVSQDAQNFDFEHRLLMPDGSVKYLRIVAHAISDESGSIEFVGAVMDTTAAKQAEEKIRQNEKELRTIIETIPAFIGTNLPDGTVDFVSQSFLDYVGLSKEQWLDWGWMTVTHPEDVELAATRSKAAFASGEPIEHEQRIRHADGTYRWTLGRNVPLRDEKGNIVKWYGVLTDIEDRKRAEQALKRSEAYLAEAQRLTHTGSWAYNPATGKTPYWSEELFRIFGSDPQRGVPDPDAFQLVHPDDRDRVSEVCRKGFREKAHFTTDFRLLLRDGTLKHLHVIWHPVLDKDGEVLEYIGTAADVTERKQAEETIREQEVELRQILDLAPQHVAVLGPEGTPLYVNQVALDYYGITLEEWRANEHRLNFVHPDDREHVMSETQSRLKRGSPHEIEARLMRNDGKYRWFLLHSNPLRDEQGRITRWYVTATDIEDRKQAEERLRHENVALREEIDQASMFEEIIGSSAAIRGVLLHVARVAPTDSTVLITGETGTGKELFARAIHKRSYRAPRAFVSVSCAAIPPSLIACELFGYEKGAFTGAVQRHLGRFELADGGTIFLDEIGELPPETQVTLLRVLQERTFERVGGSQPIAVNVRVLAATNRDLQAAVAAGAFRRDLFYRLSVFPIEVPPLRDRIDDIPSLVEYLTQRYATKAGKKIRSIKKKTLELFQAYDWPGNVRELQNVVERAVILCDGDTLTVDETWLQPQSPRSRVATRGLARLDAKQEKEMIESALTESGGRVSGPRGAAAKLGIPRSTLEARIRRLGINKYRFKSG